MHRTKRLFYNTSSSSIVTLYRRSNQNSTSRNVHNISSSSIQCRNSLRLNDGRSNIHDQLTNILSDDTKVLKWYSCGPTVYDSSHLGHARSYVCTDIIRRILSNYFNIPVDFALGITDIDDKIINKSNEVTSSSSSSIDRMLEVSRKYETSFFHDMDRLNVMRPNAILRVMEHIDGIIEYIKGIERSGCAYTCEDGVYFDIDAFSKQHDHVYGKLDCSLPPILEDRKPINGPISKKSPRDFALWKFSKPGEPEWSSPWGTGRPGWHIECSAMTHSYFGKTFDIHSGGVDLKFPHHTNEIAQCEAHNMANDWVKCWIHTGHLYIRGQKMSKSLKNFISIDDYLLRSVSDQPAVDFRIFCLQYKYSADLHFSDDRIREAKNIRQKIENHIACIQMAVDRYDYSHHQRVMRCKPTTVSMTLTQAVIDHQLMIASLLRDDFNTPEVLRILTHLLGEAHHYALTMLSSSSTSPPIEPLLAASTLAKKVLDAFGLEYFYQRHHISSASASRVASDNEKKWIVDMMVDFRSSVRINNLQAMKALSKLSKDKEALSEKHQQAISTIKDELSSSMQLCDKLRDVTARFAGIRIDDVGTKSIWSFDYNSISSV